MNSSVPDAYHFRSTPHLMQNLVLASTPLRPRLPFLISSEKSTKCRKRLQPLHTYNFLAIAHSLASACRKSSNVGCLIVDAKYRQEPASMACSGSSRRSIISRCSSAGRRRSVGGRIEETIIGFLDNALRGVISRLEYPLSYKYMSSASLLCH